MNTKNLLLTTLLLLLTVSSVVAQAIYKQPSVKDIIPFGRKLPPPDLKNYAGLRVPDKANAQAIIKDPEFYRKQFLASKAIATVAANSKETGYTGEKNENFTGYNFHLTKDINALAESYPNNPGTDSFAVLNNVAYFAADDGIHGAELWRSDGTAAGTYMVKDIAPGIESSHLGSITALTGKLYFSAIVLGLGQVVGISDGTESGTRFITLPNPNYAPKDILSFTEMGKYVYFKSGPPVLALYKTDGTSEGTILVKSDVDAPSNPIISDLIAVNGLLFFATFNYYYLPSFALWRSDGTDTGTYIINFAQDPAEHLTSYNNKLYFSLDDGTGSKLWFSDGTAGGTKPVSPDNNILIDIGGLNLNTTFPVINNVLYLACSSLSTGNGLYKYNAFDKAGIVLVKDLNSGTDTEYIEPTEMKVINNTLYFAVYNSTGGDHYELWSSTGTETQVIKRFLAGETISGLYNGSGTLYFTKSSKLLGTELWRSNGYAFGTLPVSDIFKGPTSSFPAYLTSFKGKLLFSATDEKKGNELFITEGTPGSTALVKDINTTATSGSTAGVYNTMAALGDKVLFSATENIHGDELYLSDGTAQGTFLLNDIVPGEFLTYPQSFLSKNNAVYFIENDYSNSNNVIYRSNGTKSGLQKMTPDLNVNQNPIQSFKVADNGFIYYVVFKYNTYSYELWRSDGTVAGNVLLSTTLYYSPYLNVVDNTAFFVAGDAVHGYELWKSDGNPGGTRMVKDINPGIADAAPNGMVAYKNEVYFNVYDGTNYSFWKSDGTKPGTIKLKNINAIVGFDASSTASYFGISNNVLYFGAINYANTNGIELWKTDGTPAGTKVVKSAKPSGFSGSGPGNLTDVNGTLFFASGDITTNNALWKSDGTAKGTEIVKDYVDSVPSNLTSFGGKLFFTVHSADGNNFLWSSDGTEDGTNAVSDAGISDVTISQIITAGNRLFLSGSNHEYGSELFEAELNNEIAKTSAIAISNQSIKITGTFNAVLYPNPVVSKSTLEVTGDVKNVSIVLTDMSGKKIWRSDNNNSMFIILPTENLPASVYLITIIHGSESKTIKLVKQ